MAGAYAEKLFVEELGLDASALLNCEPKVQWRWALGSQGVAQLGWMGGEEVIGVGNGITSFA